MKTIDNRTQLLCEELRQAIKPGAKVSIVAESFSIFAYQQLKKQLERASSVRFIFTAPTFIEDDADKRPADQFAIRHRQMREQDLCNSEYELRPRNTLTQRELARECTLWITSKVRFKANITARRMPAFIIVDDVVYNGIQGFTCTDLGCERGNDFFQNIQVLDHNEGAYLISAFEQLWHDEANLGDVTSHVLERISRIFRSNDPDFIYFISIYHIFNEFIQSLDEHGNGQFEFLNSKIWQMLYEFQAQAAKIILYNLEKYNGTILADSVGLGKTFTALAVIKYYLDNRKTVLVLCPKKLYENWSMYRHPYENNPLREDNLHYEILYHSDLTRTKGMSNGIDLAKFRWEDFDLIVIDESHNFRNGGSNIEDDEKRDNRYDRLLKQAIRKGRKTHVLMLSATPVNNRFVDLKNQLALSYEGNSQNLDKKLQLKHSIDDIFKSAQTEFNRWCKQPIESRTAQTLVDALDPDFFRLLEAVTIARSRKHIEKYYHNANIGKFPQRLQPISIRPELSDLPAVLSYSDVFDVLRSLNLHVYAPSLYIHPSKILKYESAYGKKIQGITLQGRELGIRNLMATNLLKRIESSIHAFRMTVTVVLEKIQKSLTAIAEYEAHHASSVLDETDDASIQTLTDDDQESVFLSASKKLEIDLADMDYLSWGQKLKQDEEILQQLLARTQCIDPEHDKKLHTLKDLIENKINHPINCCNGIPNKKIIIFSAFIDTADYLYNQLAAYIQNRYHLHTAEITGNAVRSTAYKSPNLNELLTNFSPKSKARHIIPGNHTDIDILIATDVISEGQNLQDCDYLINYDIHWNPVRIIQRFGRIDRISSQNAQIQLVNFWPNIELEEYIKLEERVKVRMTGIDVITGNVTENPLTPAEQSDLEFRRRQLERLQTEVTDLEEMNQGVSIMDLGLNEFRLDLNNYLANVPQAQDTPKGLCAAILSAEGLPPGAIFALKNIHQNAETCTQNRIHPFYLVYVSDDGEILYNHLAPKVILSKLRQGCRGVHSSEMADRVLDNMAHYSELLSCAIQSIANVHSDSTMNAFRHGRPMSFVDDTVADDFELISFIVVTEGA